MLRKDPFANRIKVSVLQQETQDAVSRRKQELQQRASRQQHAIRMERLTEFKQQYLQELMRTPAAGSVLSSVFERDDVQVSEDFLRHMSRRLFKRTVKLEEILPSITGKAGVKSTSVRAYEIGRIRRDPNTEFDKGANSIAVDGSTILPLYLCNDSLLRVARTTTTTVPIWELPDGSFVSNPIQHPEAKPSGSVSLDDTRGGKITTYRALPDDGYGIEFGHSEVKDVVRTCSESVSVSDSPHYPASTQNVVVTRTVKENVWMPSENLEQRLIAIATNK